MTTTRATQLYARFLLGSRIQATWVVFDPAHPLVDLAEDARADIAGIAAGLGVEAGSTETWHALVEDGRTWLVLDVPIQPPA